MHAGRLDEIELLLAGPCPVPSLSLLLHHRRVAARSHAWCDGHAGAQCRARGSAVCCLLSAVCCLLSAVNSQQSTRPSVPPHRVCVRAACTARGSCAACPPPGTEPPAGLRGKQRATNPAAVACAAFRAGLEIRMQEWQILRRLSGGDRPPPHPLKGLSLHHTQAAATSAHCAPARSLASCPRRAAARLPKQLPALSTAACKYL
jgi:hypothetical protein